MVKSTVPLVFFDIGRCVLPFSPRHRSLFRSEGSLTHNISASKSRLQDTPLVLASESRFSASNRHTIAVSTARPFGFKFGLQGEKMEEIVERQMGT